MNEWMNDDADADDSRIMKYTLSSASCPPQMSSMKGHQQDIVAETEGLVE